MAKQNAPTAPELNSGANGPMTAQPGQGPDVQEEIVGLLQEFVTTQNPEIAVQIALILAQEMGIAPQQQPAVTQPSPNPPDLNGGVQPNNNVPALRRGGKISIRI